MERLADYLIAWLREQVESAGLRGAVVGVSGGVDSAVVAFLLQRAFPKTALGLILPAGSGRCSRGGPGLRDCPRGD